MIIGTITLLSILVFGGGGYSFEKAYKSFVEDAVSDKSRQEQIIDVSKEADAALEQYAIEVKKVWAQDIKNIFKDFDATQDDYRMIIERADQSRMALQKSILDARMQVKDLMTEDEWNAMYKAINDKEAEAQAKKEKKDN